MKRRKTARKRNTASRAWLYGVILGGFFLVVGVMFFIQKESASESWGLPAIPRDPRPATLSPDLFTGKVKEAYRIAREVPELVEKMPCYCGCYVGNDHRNNLDCYVDRHAVGWSICLNITLDAYAMYKKGSKIEDIKRTIDEKYSRYWPYEKK